VPAALLTQHPAAVVVPMVRVQEVTVATAQGLVLPVAEPVVDDTPVVVVQAAVPQKGVVEVPSVLQQPAGDPAA